MRFGANKSGDHVEICERDMASRSTAMGTMSVEEWEALLKKRAEPREPANTGPSSRDMAAGFFERLKDEADANKAHAAADKGQPGGRKRV
jgi:hypothetical protein